jgi:Tol biopolymer transport system component
MGPCFDLTARPGFLQGQQVSRRGRTERDKSGVRSSRGGQTCETKELLQLACGSRTTKRMPAVTLLEARWRHIAAVALLAGVLTCPAVPADADPGTTELVSVDSAGNPGNGPTGFGGPPSISADGRFVAFESDATNLVPSDTNGLTDVFVHDRQTDTTERVSVSSEGTEGNGDSVFASLNADGRLVAFTSEAFNLVPGDTNGLLGDVFVHDRQTATIRRASVDSAGTQGNGDSGVNTLSLSADGRFVAFVSAASNLVPGDTNGRFDVFVHDRQTSTTERVGANAGNQGFQPSLSADGRFVAFASLVSNLVPGDRNKTDDVFVHDRQTGLTERVNVSSAGTQGNSLSGGPSVSAHGRFVAFDSFASNLVPGDTNGVFDVFVHDRANQPEPEEEVDDD